jgi:hypothetical protein
MQYLPEKKSKRERRKSSIRRGLCIVLVVVAVILAYLIVPTTGIRTVILSNNEALNFYKVDPYETEILQNIGTIASVRKLGSAEIDRIFGDIEGMVVSAGFGEDGSLKRVAGNIGFDSLDRIMDEENKGFTSVTITAGGKPTVDPALHEQQYTREGTMKKWVQTQLLGNQPMVGVQESMIAGTPVYAGFYSYGRTSNRQAPDVMKYHYFASFTLGEYSIYVEARGLQDYNELFMGDIAAVVEQLILRQAPDFSVIPLTEEVE